MQRMKLGNLFVILSGYAFRTAIESELEGNLCILQARDIRPNEPVSDLSCLLRVSLDLRSRQALLQEDDVILVNRGIGAGGFKATLYKGHADKVIASSSLLILRAKNDQLVPEYLSNLFNSELGQNMLARIATGSSIQTLLRRDLSELEIPLPDLATQNLIINLFNNIRTQQRTCKERSKLLQSLMTGTLQQITK